MATALEIVAEVHPATKALTAAWEATVLGKKAKNIYDKLSETAKKIGEEVFGKIWDALNSNGNNILDNLDVTDWPKGIRFDGMSPSDLWDNLTSSLGVPGNQIIEYISNGRPAKRFNFGGVNVAFYYSSSGFWTITINGNELKFRF